MSTYTTEYTQSILDISVLINPETQIWSRTPTRLMSPYYHLCIHTSFPADRLSKRWISGILKSTNSRQSICKVIGTRQTEQGRRSGLVVTVPEVGLLQILRKK